MFLPPRTKPAKLPQRQDGAGLVWRDWWAAPYWRQNVVLVARMVPPTWMALPYPESVGIPVGWGMGCGDVMCSAEAIIIHEKVLQKRHDNKSFP